MNEDERKLMELIMKRMYHQYNTAVVELTRLKEGLDMMQILLTKISEEEKKEEVEKEE